MSTRTVKLGRMLINVAAKFCIISYKGNRHTKLLVPPLQLRLFISRSLSFLQDNLFESKKGPMGRNTQTYVFANMSTPPNVT